MKIKAKRVNLTPDSSEPMYAYEVTLPEQVRLPGGHYVKKFRITKDRTTGKSWILRIKKDFQFIPYDQFGSKKEALNDIQWFVDKRL